MATLGVLRFADSSLSEAALPAVEDALLRRVIALEDAALISWPATACRPDVIQLFGREVSQRRSAMLRGPTKSWRLGESVRSTQGRSGTFKERRK